MTDMAELEKDQVPAGTEENTGQDAETEKTKEPAAAENTVDAGNASKEENADDALKEEGASEDPEKDDEQEDEEEAPEEGEEKGEGKKSWAERRAEKKQAKQKNDAMKEQIEQLEDKVKRQLAEFENFRNRTEREKQAMFETGARSVIEKILPVVDNFERGLATVPADHQDDAFVDGMNKVYKQLLTELDNIGVKPIEAVGKEFDPNLHNAVMQVESEEYESGIVAQELQKGYTYRDVVVRHSMVSVVQ